MLGVNRMAYEDGNGAYEAAMRRVSEGEPQGERASAERGWPRGELKGDVLRPCRPEGRLYE